MLRVLVVGGSGGIGRALITEIHHRNGDARIVGTWFRNNPLSDNSEDRASDRIEWIELNASDDEAVANLASRVGTVDWIIDASGYLHGDAGFPEKTIESLDTEFFLQNIRSNVFPTLLLAKHMQSNLNRKGSSVFATLSAKVGSIEDNRLGGWTSYRCSKAALNMAIKNISIEWTRRNPETCVVALHPGTTATDLSAPFQRNVPEHQLFTTRKTAGLLLDRLVNLKPADTGKFFAFDGEELPW